MSLTPLKTFFIALILLVSVLFYALTNWFEKETKKVYAINQEHYSQIKRLQKIESINTWLKERIIPFIATLPKTQNATDKKLIDFFDTYSHTLNLNIDKYLYHDDGTYKMQMEYAIPINKKKEIETLLNLKFPTGYIWFNSLKKKGENINGVLTVIQPLLGDINVSQ